MRPGRAATGFKLITIFLKKLDMTRILVLAPHPDDEILGCGGYLAQQVAGGARVRVIIVSDGAAGLSPGVSSVVREAETRAGLAALGVEDVTFWGYADGAVPVSGAIAEGYRSTVEAFRPHEICLPAPSESHPDHRRTTRGALRALEGHWSGWLRFYETTQPLGTCNSWCDLGADLERKLSALACHASQQAQWDYLGYTRHLASLRGVGRPGPAEAFLLHEWDGTSQHFFETRPTISVIVRAGDAGLLRHALTSLTQQLYDQLEVIVVWHGEGTPDLTPAATLDAHWVAGGNNRADNLNRGLQWVRGEYVAFLDYDDVLFPAHFALLLPELHGAAERDIAHADCRVVACDDHGAVVKVVDERMTSHRHERLMLGNFIPLHSVLFRAGLFHLQSFDPALPAYEDWEMLARLWQSGAHFVHVAEVTCEYRLYGPHSDSIADNHAAKGYGAARTAVLERIRQRMTPAHLDELMVLVDAHEQTESRLQRQLAQVSSEVNRLETTAAEYAEQQAALRRLALATGRSAAGTRLPQELAGRALAEHLAIDVVLPVYNCPQELLVETLESLFAQSFPNWTLCLVDDGSTSPDTRRVLQSLEHRSDPRIRMAWRSDNGGIVAASNDALRLSNNRWVAFLDHDDRLDPDALMEVALAILEQPTARLIYTDSRLIDRSGEVLHIFHKPDWSPETLLAINYFNHLTVIRRDQVPQGGLDDRWQGSQDWALLLGLLPGLDDAAVIHIAKPLYDWRATESSVAYRTEAKPWALEAAVRLLADTLVGWGHSDARAEVNYAGSGLRVVWTPHCQPLQVVIPSHRNATGLARILADVQAEHYPELSIQVVLNRAGEAVRAAAQHAAAGDPRIRLIDDPRLFNWAALNNRAVDLQQGWLLFLNDDVEAIEPGWLLRLLRYLELPGVGAVGATLLFPNGAVQHNGIATSREHIAMNIGSLGNRNEWALSRNVSAVTGACLATSVASFQAVGGFDERFAHNYNDVDFCLALRNRGLRILQADDARLIHRESSTRGTPDPRDARWQDEMALMRDKWGDLLVERYGLHYEALALGSRILHVAGGYP